MSTSHSSASNPDNTSHIPSSLLSIILITRTRAGPRLLLHYPPPPTSFPSRHASAHTNSASANSPYNSTFDLSSSSASGLREDEGKGDAVGYGTTRPRRSTGTGWGSATTDTDDFGSDGSSASDASAAGASSGGNGHTPGAYRTAGVRPRSRQKDMILGQEPASSAHQRQQRHTQPNRRGVSNSHTHDNTPDTDNYSGSHGQAATFAPSSDSETSSPDLAPRPSTSAHHPITSPPSDDGNASSPNGADEADADRARHSWDFVLGHSLAGMAKLLAPTSRTWHKRRFEVGIEGRAFLGCPVFERVEGGWGRRRRKVRGRGGERGVGWEGPAERGVRGGEAGAGDEDAEVHNGDESEEVGADVDEAESTNDEDEQSSTEELEKADSKDTADDYDGDEEISPTNTRTHRPPHPSQRPPANAATTTSTLAIPFGTSHSSPESDPHSLASTTGIGTPTPETLTMFNVVLVLTPLPSHHQSTIQTLYRHILLKLAVALKERQKRTHYVWVEMRKIIALREKARNSGAEYSKTLPFIMRESSLARALKETWDSVVESRVAHVLLDEGVQLSLQVPRAFAVAYVPVTGKRDVGGENLWLTSYNAFGSDSDGVGERDVERSGPVSPHSALLLLVPPASLLKEIAAARQMAPGLAKALTLYVQHTTPTKSLLQLSKKLRLSLADLQLLSLHLIHWRRARPIPPLHPSHIYIVSPLADFSNLSHAARIFAARFAALPSLVELLGKLSSTASKGPVPWASFIPSSDHKAPYMEILEWLVRGGWVTQLRTFAWVVVSKDAKAEVARQMQREEREKRAAAAAQATLEEDEFEDEEVEETIPTPQSEVDARPKRRQSSFGSSAGPSSLLSPRLRPHRTLLPFSPRRKTSDSGSASSAQTAIRISSGRAKHDVSPLRVSRNSSTNTHSRHRLSSSSVQSRVHVEAADQEADTIFATDFEPSIVVSPHKANALESRWLEYIGQTLPDEDLRQMWPKLLKYLDGGHAIEEITLREAMKRKVVNPMLSRLMGELGLLRIVRHW